MSLIQTHLLITEENLRHQEVCNHQMYNHRKGQYLSRTNFSAVEILVLPQIFKKTTQQQLFINQTTFSAINVVLLRPINHTFHTIHNKLKPIQCDQCTFASPYKRKKETIDRHVNTIHKPSSSEIPTTLDQDKPHIEPPEKKLKPDQLPSATNESKIEFDNNSLNEILNQNILFCPQCNCNNGR